MPKTMVTVKYTDTTQYCSQTAVLNLRLSGVFTTPSKALQMWSLQMGRGNGTQQCITMTEMREAADSSEIFVIIFLTTNYHIPQYSYLIIKVT